MYQTNDNTTEKSENGQSASPNQSGSGLVNYPFKPARGRCYIIDSTPSTPLLNKENVESDNDKKQCEKSNRSKACDKSYVKGSSKKSSDSNKSDTK